jgi:LysM repeat protein
MGEVLVTDEATAQAASTAVFGERRITEDLLLEVDRILGGAVYQIGEGETILDVAKRFGTTVAALQRANGLRSQQVKPGQRMKVPAVAGCGLSLPSSPETQMLAGAIFAEASAKAESNDEREAIGWAFVNSVRHVRALCSGELECPGMTDAGLRKQCERDRASLGLTIAESIEHGSVAYGHDRWNMVMTGNVLLPAANLCLLTQDEVTAMARAIEAAEAVLGGTAAPRDYLRFNQSGTPPYPPRQEQSGKHESHTFYRFKPGSECG